MKQKMTFYNRNFTTLHKTENVWGPKHNFLIHEHFEVYGQLARKKPSRLK